MMLFKYRKLYKIFNNSLKINIDNKTKIVIMSDCHRGIGDYADNFRKNKNLFKRALNYYYKNDFSYIELGDGDEMWEVKNYKDIIYENRDVFSVLNKFYKEERFIMIYGNHDIIKKSKEVIKEVFTSFYKPLVVYESLVLNYNGYEMFLLHGHQADFFNDEIWFVSRFLVRNVWKRLENIGVKNLSGLAKNNKISKKSEKIFSKWSLSNNKIIISGHTHRPVFPKNGLYFNAGACVFPNGITALEIEEGFIKLVKWVYKIDEKGFIFAGREDVSERKNIIDFFEK